MTTAAVANPGLVRALLAGPAEAVAAELSRSTLLVPVSPLGGDEGLVRRGRTAGGRTLVWAFSDEEALRAWDRHPAEAVVALDPPALAKLDAILALNPAGPGAWLADPAALEPRAVSAPTGLPVSALELPEARSSLRRRAAETHRRGGEAARAGQLDRARRELEDCLAACGELGDRLHGASAALELAWCLARMDSIERALAVWEGAVEVLARFGEGDLAVTALLEAAEAAAQAGRAGDAERLSIDALELAVGPEFADRLTSLWSRLDALRDPVNR